MKLIRWLLGHRRWWPAQQLLYLLGVEVAVNVPIGNGLRLEHRGRGLVVGEFVAIGERVTLYHNVTVGLGGDPSSHPIGGSPAVVIGDDVTLFPGAVVLGTPERPTVVGNGTIVAANAVLTRSTGQREIWAGVPARRQSSV